MKNDSIELVANPGKLRFILRDVRELLQAISCNALTPPFFFVFYIVWKFLILCDAFIDRFDKT